MPLECLTGGPEEIDRAGHRAFGFDEPPPPEAWIPSGSTRLVDLARPAAREAWIASGLADRPDSRVGLYVGLDPRDEATPVIDAITNAIGVRPVLAHAERAGRAATLVAIRQAAKDFLAGKIDAALVAQAIAQLP